MTLRCNDFHNSKSETRKISLKRIPLRSNDMKTGRLLHKYEGGGCGFDGKERKRKMFYFHYIHTHNMSFSFSLIL